MKKFWFMLKNGSRQNGDTIVEVMISMTVLAVVIAAAYSMANNSYQSGLNAQYRSQALSYSQQQIELLREADNNNPQSISTYTNPSNPSPFCINPSTKEVVAASSGGCTNPQLFTVMVFYDSSTKTFKVVTNWAYGGAKTDTQQSILFYKPNDSFTDTVKACSPSDPTCSSTATDVPNVTVTANPTSVNVGDTSVITWVLTNVKTGSCAASGSGGFGSIDPNNTALSPYTTSALNTVGDNIFTVSCTDNAGSTLTGSAKVTVIRPVPSVATGSAKPGTVTYNSATVTGAVNPNGFVITNCVFYYDANQSFAAGSTYPSHGTAIKCVESVGGGTSSVTVSASPAGLVAVTPYNFQLCAANTYGIACGNNSRFTTTSAPLATISLSADVNPVAYGQTTNLHLRTTNATYCESSIWGQVPVNWDVTVGAGTYYFRCNNGYVWTNSGNWSSYTINSSAYPSLTLSADINPVAYGGTTALHLRSSNTTYCESSNWGQVPVNWDVNAGAGTYYFRCHNGYVWTNGGNWSSYTINSNPYPTLSLSADVNPVAYGQGTALHLRSSNTVYCEMYGYGQVPVNWDVWEGAGTYYFLCHNGYVWTNGGNWTSYTINQNSPPPPPPDCNDHSHNKSYSGYGSISWSSSIGGNNPCGVTVSQCNVFNSGGGELAQVGSSGSGYWPGAAYVNCMDIMGHWF